MIEERPVPLGTYSVSFQTWWRHPFTSKNAYDHRVFHVYEDMNETTLAEQIALYMTEHSGGAKCHMVKIQSIQRLDNPQAVAI